MTKDLITGRNDQSATGDLLEAKLNHMRQEGYKAIDAGWRSHNRLANFPHHESNMRVIGFVVPISEKWPMACIQEQLAEIIEPATPEQQTGWTLVPNVMTEAMINAWSGGTTVTSDSVAARTTFQDGWRRVLAAAPTPECTHCSNSGYLPDGNHCQWCALPDEPKTEIDHAIDKLIYTAWYSGEQDGSEGVAWNERGDSYNGMLRDNIQADRKALIALLSENPEPEGSDALAWGASTWADLQSALDGAHELSGAPHERIKELIRQRDDARAIFAGNIDAADPKKEYKGPNLTFDRLTAMRTFAAKKSEQGFHVLAINAETLLCLIDTVQHHEYIPPPKVDESEWIKNLRKELMLSKMTHSFNFTRDEVIELLGGKFALIKGA